MCGLKGLNSRGNSLNQQALVIAAVLHQHWSVWGELKHPPGWQRWGLAPGKLNSHLKQALISVKAKSLLLKSEP